MNCLVNYTSWPLVHFIGHRRMTSVVPAAQESSSSWVKIAKLPLNNLVSSQHSPDKGKYFNYFLHFFFTLFKANMPLWWKLFSTVWQFITHPWVCFFLSLSFSAFKLIVQTFIFTEVSLENIFKYGIDMSWPRCKPLKSGFLNPATPHSLWTGLSTSLSRCSEERRKKTTGEPRALVLISLPCNQRDGKLFSLHFILVATNYGYCYICHRKYSISQDTHTQRHSLSNSLELKEIRDSHCVLICVIYNRF